MGQIGPQPSTQVPPPPAGGEAAYAAPGTNTFAVVSFAAGVAGYIIPHPFLAGIIAIVTGHMARRQIRKTGEGGATLALIGLILGYVHLALSILLVVGIILVLVGVLGFGIFAAAHQH